VVLIKFASSSLLTKVHLEKKPQSKNLTVRNREFDFLFLTVEFFLITFFFLGELLKANSRYLGTYLHHTVSMVRLPDPDLLIFPSTCTGTLVPGYFQKQIFLYMYICIYVYMYIYM
jgi:hypothetical protein